MEKIFAFNTTLAVLTIIGMGILVLFVVILLAHKKLGAVKIYQWFLEKKAWMGIAFFLAFLAVLGTLIYSELIGFPPCRLCWFQRIFMYPVLVLLGAGLFRKETIIVPYVKLLAFGGAIVALYHYVVQMSPTVSAACGAIGESCDERLVFEFGFVTIPLMSLLIFVMIFVLMFFREKN